MQFKVNLIGSKFSRLGTDLNQPCYTFILLPHLHFIMFTEEELSMLLVLVFLLVYLAAYARGVHPLV